MIRLALPTATCCLRAVVRYRGRRHLTNPCRPAIISNASRASPHVDRRCLASRGPWRAGPRPRRNPVQVRGTFGAGPATVVGLVVWSCLQKNSPRAGAGPRVSIGAGPFPPVRGAWWLPLVLIASAARWRCGTSVLVLCSMASRVDARESGAAAGAAARLEVCVGTATDVPRTGTAARRGIRTLRSSLLVCLTR